MTELLARAARFREEPGVLSISINAGFPSGLFNAHYFV